MVIVRKRHEYLEYRASPWTISEKHLLPTRQKKMKILSPLAPDKEEKSGEVKGREGTPACAMTDILPFPVTEGLHVTTWLIILQTKAITRGK